MKLLVKGNTKLGKTIWHFSIPASTTCPGRSNLCNARCYAQRSTYAYPNVKRSLSRRLRLSKGTKFVENMIKEIHNVKARIVRIHCAGDFYSEEYVKKWYAIIRTCKDVKFFTYTRSWRVPAIRSALTVLSTLSNLRLWYSVDQETGVPARKPKSVRIAYMSVHANDDPDGNSDLIFRDYNVRNQVAKFIKGIIVCPVENGTENNITCEKCKICYDREHIPRQEYIPKRVSLALVA